MDKEIGLFEEGSLLDELIEASISDEFSKVDMGFDDLSTLQTSSSCLDEWEQ